MDKKNRTESKNKYKILFVCLGNICRSPTAESVLKKIVQEKGQDDFFHIESAGTGHYHIGERPDPRTLRHGEKRGLIFDSFAQQFNPQLHFEYFDYILCMDDNNFKNILQLDPEKKYHSKVFPMMHFASQTSYSFVPDPYHGNSKDFELVIDLLEEACLNFFLKIHKP